MSKFEIGSIVTNPGCGGVEKKIISIDSSVNRATCEWKDKTTKEIKTAIFDIEDLRDKGESINMLDLL